VLCIGDIQSPQLPQLKLERRESLRRSIMELTRHPSTLIIPQSLLVIG
jgi:hypothetical protein